MAARFFMRLALVIALGRRCGRRFALTNLALINLALTSGFLMNRFVLGAAMCLAFFGLAAIAGGLFSAFLFAVVRGPVVQVGLGDSPPPSRCLASVAAVPIEGMIRRKIAIAPLE